MKRNTGLKWVEFKICSGSFSWYVRKIFRKGNISYSLIRTPYAHFVNVLNEWSLRGNDIFRVDLCVRVISEVVQWSTEKFLFWKNWISWKICVIESYFSKEGFCVAKFSKLLFCRTSLISCLRSWMIHLV